MGLLDTESGKRRLLCVEVPAIERYNEGRGPDFKVQVLRGGTALTLRYQLKPCHNVYLLETRLHSGYPTVPPETRVLTPLRHCPHLLEGHTLCLWLQGSTPDSPRSDPAKFTAYRLPGGVAMAGVLRSVARDRGMAFARSQVKSGEVKSQK